MAEFLDTATQCNLLTDADVSQYDQKDCTRPVIDSDDKDKSSLSSLLNMFGIKHFRTTRNSRDYTNLDNISTDSNTNSPQSANRINTALRRVVPIDIVNKDIFHDRNKLMLSENLAMEQSEIWEDNIWSSVEPVTPTTPDSSSYKHPWL